MKTAANLLKSKAHQSVHTIAPEASVFDAIKLMADKNIGALLVMEAEEVAGIITERDYARKIVLVTSCGSTMHRRWCRSTPCPRGPRRPGSRSRPW